MNKQNVYFLRVINRQIRRIRYVFGGISLRRDSTFIPNIILCVGAVLIWRGVWNLVDLYIFPDYPLVSNFFSILLGLFLIYLPDNNFTQLGGFEINKETPEKHIEHDHEYTVKTNARLPKTP